LAVRLAEEDGASDYAASSALKKRLVAALCERRRVYFCGNPAVTDRRYSLKRVFKRTDRVRTDFPPVAEAEVEAGIQAAPAQQRATDARRR